LLVTVAPHERDALDIVTSRFHCLFESEHGMQAAILGAECLAAEADDVKGGVYPIGNT
jgi:hypothetical protein